MEWGRREPFPRGLCLGWSRARGGPCLTGSSLGWCWVGKDPVQYLARVHAFGVPEVPELRAPRPVWSPQAPLPVSRRSILGLSFRSGEKGSGLGAVGHLSPFSPQWSTGSGLGTGAVNCPFPYILCGHNLSLLEELATQFCLF